MTAPTRRWNQQGKAARSAGVLMLVMLLAVAATGAAYIVKPGDTLSEIAAAHETSVGAIVEANGLRNPDRIIVGQQLEIPGSGGAATTLTHTVAYGEFLSGIAHRYGVSLTSLAAANGITNPNRIRAGQTLVIPSAGTTEGSAPLVHLVQRGESLASIAGRYGIKVADLAAANGMTPTSIIYTGTRLRISPLPPTFTPETSGPGIYTVVAGDTLGEIAAAHDTGVTTLLDLNDLADPDRIYVGQQLQVPSGGFVCPVPGASFFNDWGFPRSRGRFHQGNDLFAPRRTPVLAPAAGRVEQVTGTVGGLQFWLYGDDGTVYIGTHMEAFGAAGQVAAGTVIGYVGDSGNAVGARPHLHFEIIVDDVAINPFPHLRSACG
jgi:LysM repeat protein